MQIILVSNRLTHARSVELTAKHLIVAVLGLAILLVGGAVSLSYLSLRHAADGRLPFVGTIVSAATDKDAKRNDAFVRENVNALAVKLGEMQAQLTRLDALGERLLSITGLKSRDLNIKLGDTPGRGGTPDVTGGALSFDELSKELERVSLQVDNRSDYLRLMEDELVREKVRTRLLPSAPPIDVPYPVSGFGWRIDPFTGRRANHEGIDFAAPIGTPIFAAAGGIVIAAEPHPTYGNMVDLEHANGLTTRYAHASKLLVKLGDVVKRGQKIAEVGSTGHSTGPHLHFEVRQGGNAQNPSRFLQALAK